MKKTIAMFLILSACLFGCNDHETIVYSTWVADVAHDGYEVSLEQMFWTGEYFVKDGMSGAVCQFQGKTYTGTYEKSICNKLNSYTTDRYDAGNQIEFGLRHDTGELVYLNLMTGEFFSTEPYLPDVPNPYENALDMAADIAEEYVGDLNDYTRITYDPKVQHKEKDGVQYELTYYMVTYAKKINGYFTSDYIDIQITSKGHVASIYMGDINAFANVSFAVEQQSLTQSISDKLTTVYQGKKVSLDAYELKDQKVVIAPDGQVCMYSDVRISFKETDIKTSIVLLTMLK